MAISTLAELRAAIKDFGMSRTDITDAAADNMILLAETDILHGTYDGAGNMITQPLRVRSMETLAPTFTLSGEYTPLPSGYLEMREVKWANQTGKPPLKWMSPEAFDSVYSDGDSGPARAWTIVGDQIRVGPGAGVTDQLYLIYYAAFTTVTGGSPNWILTNYPNVYLYGALRHLAPYIGAPEMLGTWQPAFVSALRGLIASQNRGSYSGTSLAQRSVGMTVT